MQPFFQPGAGCITPTGIISGSNGTEYTLYISSGLLSTHGFTPCLYTLNQGVYTLHDETPAYLGGATTEGGQYYGYWLSNPFMVNNNTYSFNFCLNAKGEAKIIDYTLAPHQQPSSFGLTVTQPGKTSFLGSIQDQHGSAHSLYCSSYHYIDPTNPSSYSQILFLYTINALTGAAIPLENHPTLMPNGVWQSTFEFDSNTHSLQFSFTPQGEAQVHQHTKIPSHEQYTLQRPGTVDTTYPLPSSDSNAANAKTPGGADMSGSGPTLIARPYHDIISINYTLRFESTSYQDAIETLQNHRNDKMNTVQSILIKAQKLCDTDEALNFTPPVTQIEELPEEEATVEELAKYQENEQALYEIMNQWRCIHELNTMIERLQQACQDPTSPIEELIEQAKQRYDSIDARPTLEDALEEARALKKTSSDGDQGSVPLNVGDRLIGAKAQFIDTMIAANSEGKTRARAAEEEKRAEANVIKATKHSNKQLLRSHFERWSHYTLAARSDKQAVNKADQYANQKLQLKTFAALRATTLETRLLRSHFERWSHYTLAASSDKQAENKADQYATQKLQLNTFAALRATTLETRLLRSHFERWKTQSACHLLLQTMISRLEQEQLEERQAADILENQTTLFTGEVVHDTYNTIVAEQAAETLRKREEKRLKVEKRKRDCKASILEITTKQREGTKLDQLQAQLDALFLLQLQDKSKLGKKLIGQEIVNIKEILEQQKAEDSATNKNNVAGASKSSQKKPRLNMKFKKKKQFSWIQAISHPTLLFFLSIPAALIAAEPTLKNQDKLKYITSLFLVGTALGAGLIRCLWPASCRVTTRKPVTEEGDTSKQEDYWNSACSFWPDAQEKASGYYKQARAVIRG